jgi:hypothetical protein
VVGDVHRHSQRGQQWRTVRRLGHGFLWTGRGGVHDRGQWQQRPRRVPRHVRRHHQRVCCRRSNVPHHGLFISHQLRKHAHPNGQRGHGRCEWVHGTVHRHIKCGSDG